MRLLPTTLVVFGLFAYSCVFAQTNSTLISTNNLNVREIKYPEWKNSGNSEYDLLIFQKAVLNFAINYRDYPTLENTNNPNRYLEQWNKENPVIAKDLKVFTYADYLSLKKKIDILDYPPFPQKINTGDEESDELVNKNKLKEWMERHPDYPPYTEDMEALRKARLVFYDQYVKPYQNQ